MPRSRHDRILNRAVLLGYAMLALGCIASPSTAAGQTASGSLRILLTNDDGYTAGGITAMREALIAGGHEVIVVAPSENQSGSSARRSSGTFTYTEAAPGVWHVNGSPADALLMALNVVMIDDLPDLVVSGTNSGQNIGSSTSHSGTVGAAVTAARQGIPAIAVSAELRARGGAQGPYVSTGEAFLSAGAFTLDLIDQLVANSPPDGSLLPPNTILNVNYPALPREALLGVRFVPVSSASAYDYVYRPTDTAGEMRVSLQLRNPDDVEPGTDFSLLTQGYVTINVIDATGDVGGAGLEAVSGRVRLERE